MNNLRNRVLILSGGMILVASVIIVALHFALPYFVSDATICGFPYVRASTAFGLFTATAIAIIIESFHVYQYLKYGTIHSNVPLVIQLVGGARADRRVIDDQQRKTDKTYSLRLYYIVAAVVLVYICIILVLTLSEERCSWNVRKEHLGLYAELTNMYNATRTWFSP